MKQAIASYVEQDCTIEHEGQKFSASGAIVTDKFITAYIGKDGDLTDWHGKQIGRYRIISSWRTPRSFVSSHMHSVECFVNGIRYVGRSSGTGMYIRAKRSPRQWDWVE